MLISFSTCKGKLGEQRIIGRSFNFDAQYETLYSTSSLKSLFHANGAELSANFGEFSDHIFLINSTTRYFWN